MPQNPQSKPVIILPNGKEVPFDTPPEVMRQMGGMPSLLGQPVNADPDIRAAQAKSGHDYMQSPDFLKDSASNVLDLAGLASSFLFPEMGMAGAGLRGGINGALGAAKAGINGSDPFTSYVENMAMDTGSYGASRMLPKAGYRFGLAMGGAKGEGKQATEAFIRQRDRLPFGKAPVLGGVEKTGGMIGDAGKRLEKAELAGGGRAPLTDLMGYADRNYDTAINASHPLDVRDVIASHERKTIEQQAVARANGGRGTSQDLTAIRARDAAAKPVDVKMPHPQQAAYNKASQGAKAAGVMTTPADNELLDQVESILGKGSTKRVNPPSELDELIGSTDLGVRDLGEIKRSAARSGQDVIKARQGGSFVPPNEALNAQNEADLAQLAKKLQLDIADPDQRALIEKANKELSDLFTMQNANKVLRGGGGVLTDIGQLGVRGGFGSGVAQNVANVTGQNNPILKGLAGVLSPLLAPSSISRIGSASGRVSRALPAFARTLVAGNDISSTIDKAKKPVQKRTPK